MRGLARLFTRKLAIILSNSRFLFDFNIPFVFGDYYFGADFCMISPNALNVNKKTKCMHIGRC